MNTKTFLATVSAVALLSLSGISAASATTLYAEPKVKEPTVSIVQDPAAVPAPEKAGKRAPKTHQVTLNTTEVESKLDDGTTYTYWTFNNTIPGPMVRVRVGDTVDVKIANAKDSTMNHSVDFHAATGFLGGGQITQVEPGQTKEFSFKALTPGVYVYHCATPMVAHHISKGMYGLIVVEPEAGMPAVDHEYYVMQQEVYATKAKNIPNAEDDYDGLVNEKPNYLVFNGAVGALSKDKPLKVKVGETVRIWFGVGGPNLTSSFHVIGEIFDRVYNMGGLESEPNKGVQTVTVAPGGATMVEFKVDYPGKYALVDHALSRATKGLIGILEVEGPANDSIIKDKSGDSRKQMGDMQH
ncbi:copper-containing nitrite reductase [Azospirillum rugosum]|uniref:Copper-containing nitrite reductase n=1 Tax=Azospirillum rugosum TaxID=416170 RepID=A0ABS4SRA3_9PROT|nr:copper-containing nitrite reductase [Azospirillum rugosum]MBP2295078.1 nitrite reductase (NO-forming) [Azospirillum rugosum]MDQ0528901.1 nitrite reductase (NO-forming) [Azospirillum rugosum]